MRTWRSTSLLSAEVTEVNPTQKTIISSCYLIGCPDGVDVGWYPLQTICTNNCSTIRQSGPHGSTIELIFNARLTCCSNPSITIYSIHPSVHTAVNWQIQSHDPTKQTNFGKQLCLPNMFWIPLAFEPVATFFGWFFLTWSRHRFTDDYRNL